jgi:hypothetical protein
MRRREVKNRPERPRGSPETDRVELNPAKIPAETAYREAAPGFAVLYDWMVGVTGIEPVTPPLAVSDYHSLVLSRGYHQP